MSEALQAENQNLKNQVTQGQAAIEGMLAQLDASKQMYNESINSCLQLRTQLISMQNAMKKGNAVVEALNKQLADANARIAELSNPQSKDVQPDPQV